MIGRWILDGPSLTFSNNLQIPLITSKYLQPILRDNTKKAPEPIDSSAYTKILVLNYLL